MEVVPFAAAPFYSPPNHEGVTARRLQGDQASSAAFAWVGHSIFPPGVSLPMEAGPIDKIYVVIEGELAVTEADGTRHVLKLGDSILIAANQARAVVNDSGAPAAIIVITPPPIG